MNISQNTGNATAGILANLNLKLSPNPNTGEFKIELNAPVSEKYTISVTDMTGSTIFTEYKYATAGINTWTIASPKFQKGVYLLHIQSSTAGITQNFVVDK